MPGSVKKGEFARLINVSPGRVSQYLAEGKIHGAAIEGTGRDARIVVDVAKAQLQETLDARQMLGNGASTRLGDATTEAEAAGETEPADRPPSNVVPIAGGRGSEFNAVRTETETWRARMARLEYEKAIGKYLYVDDVQDAMTRTAEAIVRDLDRLPSHAEDLAAALARGGMPALRDEIRKVVRTVRETLARSMTLLAIEDAAAAEADGDAMDGDEDAPGDEL
jgi:hypothetical protein